MLATGGGDRSDDFRIWQNKQLRSTSNIAAKKSSTYTNLRIIKSGRREKRFMKSQGRYQVNHYPGFIGAFDCSKRFWNIVPHKTRANTSTRSNLKKLRSYVENRASMITYTVGTGTSVDRVKTATATFLPAPVCSKTPSLEGLRFTYKTSTNRSGWRRTSFIVPTRGQYLPSTFP